MERKRLQVKITAPLKALSAAAGIPDARIYADMMILSLADTHIILTKGRLGDMSVRAGHGNLYPQLVKLLHKMWITDPTVADYTNITNIELEDNDNN